MFSKTRILPDGLNDRNIFITHQNLYLQLMQRRGQQRIETAHNFITAIEQFAESALKWKAFSNANKKVLRRS